MELTLTQFSLHIQQVFDLKKTLINSTEVNVSLPESGLISFLMPEGSGKSTLAKALSGIHRGYTGSCLCITKNPTIQPFPLISSENNTLAWLTVRKNVMFLPDKVPLNIFNSALEMTGLDGYEDHTPSEQSYGFKIRIALARAICAGTKIIILDDPFGRCDETTINELFAVIKNMIKTGQIGFILLTKSIEQSFRYSDVVVPFNQSMLKFENSITLTDSTRTEMSQKFLQHQFS